MSQCFVRDAGSCHVASPAGLVRSRKLETRLRNVKACSFPGKVVVLHGCVRTHRICISVMDAAMLGIRTETMMINRIFFHA